MEKPGHEQQQQQQGALKCPRCDSSNTKFCYYNNYSLSQPRHLCKACKRYWTRGGTLRNVPVGGGCRKNKHHRIKRPSTSTIDPSSAPPHSQLHQMDAAAAASNHHINPLFYGLAAAAAAAAGAGSNPCDDVNNNLALFSSRFISSSRIPSSSGLFDLIQQPPRMNNALGLGFSSGVMSRNNGFITTSNISNDDNNNTPFPISYSSIFSSSASSSTRTTTTTSPVMMPNNNSSVLGSSMMMMMQQQQQQKVMNNNNNGGKDDGGRNMITSFDEGLVEVAPQMGISGGGDDDVHVQGVEGASKDVKVELGQNRLLELSWNNTTPSNSNNNNGAGGGGSGSGTNFQNQQHVNGMMTISDPNSNSLYWNSAAALGGSNWSDQPNNIAPSLTSFSHLATKLH